MLLMVAFDEAARFWAKVDVRRGRKPCWLWQGASNALGYGRFQTTSTGRKTWQAHRLAYTLLNGEIEDGLVVMHTCDTPACVNPYHLDVGTQAENTKDRDDKGRRATPANKIQDFCDSCDERHVARGMCRSHYNKWYAANRR